MNSSALFGLGMRHGEAGQGIEVIGEASCDEDLIGLVHSFHRCGDFLSGDSILTTSVASNHLAQSSNTSHHLEAKRSYLGES